jgi:hypothetical protein
VRRVLKALDVGSVFLDALLRIGMGANRVVRATFVEDQILVEAANRPGTVYSILSSFLTLRHAGCDAEIGTSAFGVC